jgi:hypothetical protein
MFAHCNHIRIVMSAGVLALAATAARAADLAIDWYTIDGGGAMFTTGGTLELSGTVGQPDAGAALTGGDLRLVGGFWAGAAAEEPFCFGDFDGDNDIDLADLANLLGNYGQSSGMAYEDGDLDGDGDVDLADLASLLGVYGTTCP